jgi:hypothetical protein
MPDSFVRTPYGLLVFGLFLLFLGVAGTLTGEAWGRFGRVVYRAKEPGKFWRLVAALYLGGVCLIGYYLYKVYDISN